KKYPVRYWTSCCSVTNNSILPPFHKNLNNTALNILAIDLYFFGMIENRCFKHEKEAWTRKAKIVSPSFPAQLPRNKLDSSNRYSVNLTSALPLRYQIRNRNIKIFKNINKKQKDEK